MNYRQWKKSYKKRHGYNPPLEADKRQAAGDRPQPTPSDGGFMDIPDGYDDGLPFD